MAKWDEALEKQALLAPASFEQMWTPVKLNDGSRASYGFGWNVEKNALGHRLIEHGGAWQGFATYIGRHPDEHLTVVVLCNRAGANPGYIANIVAGTYIPALAPRPHSTKRIDPAILNSYAGEYRLNNRLTVKMTAVDGHLETSWLGQKLLLEPQSETVFAEEDSDRTVRFIRARGGHVTAAVISVPEELTLLRVP
jgi:CubicO group peptidase (beta-lactamase class C family)